jgi:membrane-associated phospholipid phosphatase
MGLGSMTDNDRLRRADRLIWAFIAIIAAVVVTACVAGTFHLEWASFAKVAIVSLLLGLASGFYSFRKEERVASALQCTAQFALFPAVAAPISYVAASAALPLWDETFVSWDRRLGLDWMAWLASMNNHPMLHEVFAQAYSSFLPQAAVVILALALSGHLLHLRLYILSFIFTALITIAISAVLPAQGIWGYFQLSPSNYPNITPVTQELHLNIFHGLRDGSFRELVAQGAEGIITFPSLHTAGGWLFIFAMWPVRYLRWVFLLLNLTMIVATPVDGGHYFSDVIAGTATAVLCWMAAARIVFGSKSSEEEIVRLAIAPSIEPELNPLLPKIAVVRRDEAKSRSIAQA